jgi:nicotinamide-nucleotide amidase
MKAEIIAVGSELLTPYRRDTNSLFLTERLNRLGIEVIRKSIVGDDRARLREAFEQALARADLVISIGGLGPTEDDLTREAVAELLGRRLNRDENVLREIQARFRRIGRKMAAVNERQALVPEGATALPNPNGTAPGLWLEAGERIVVLLPGPPPELVPMFREHVEPRLAGRAGGVELASRDLRVTGMPEADLDQLISPIYTLYPDVQTTVLAAPGEIEVHLRAWSAERAAAEKTLDEMVERLVLALGENVFTTGGESLEEVVARLLTLHHATIAVAESCTGGLVAARLTNIAGSSSYLLGGVVCYSNELKSAWVDVPAGLIEARGPVSAEVTTALAENIRRRSGATLGLAITGIAGPGGTPEIPAGTVHIALANGEATKSRSARFPGDRERVRRQASQMALDTVRRYFLYANRKV